MPNSAASVKPEMPGNLDSMLMDSLNGGCQSVVGNVGIRLERGRALRDPVIDEAPRLLRRMHHRHLNERSAGPLNIRAGHIHCGAGYHPVIDELLYI